MVTARGSQLAALFMMGVETALFANDACGAPVPWLMCCPWLFFDGKLFHAKLIRANCARSLVEVIILYLFMYLFCLVPLHRLRFHVTLERCSSSSIPSYWKYYLVLGMWWRNWFSSQSWKMQAGYLRGTESGVCSSTRTSTTCGWYTQSWSPTSTSTLPRVQPLQW